MSSSVHTIARTFGFDLVRYPPSDIGPTTRETLKAVQRYTLTSPERIHALCEAVRYVIGNGIEGSIVECGVWRGGSMMAAARTLLEAGETDRQIWLYDTFEGMVPPGPLDRFVNGQSAAEILGRDDRQGRDVPWCRADLSDVRAALATTGYPAELCRFVPGRVEETIPAEMPDRIAILRLDTDWYESTRHELIHLFPLISPGGVLLIDDYGAWEGARRAVDEFLCEQALPLLLCRIDSTGRIAIVPR